MDFSNRTLKVDIFAEKTNEIFQILNYFSNFVPNSTMTGIYIHIPFCASRCIYCAFYSTVKMELRQQYADALCREMTMGPTADTISTIYLGGGTPSQLTVGQLQQLLDGLYNIYKVAEDAEVTIEVNPDDVTPALAEALSRLPVNRVSMGAQTFDDQRLRFLRRRHTARQVGEAVARLRTAGISNISVDLMYGFPDETLDDWQRDIDSALSLDVEHLSAYCLSIEEGTPLYEKVHKGNVSFCVLCNEEVERTMYYTLIDRLAAAGYEHYEISNFARRGYRSRHNSSYWTDIPYIGLGAAAHSYDGQRRRWNVSDLQHYIEGAETGHIDYEEEVLDDDTRYNDRVMLSLRTAEGLDLSTLTAHDRAYLLENARRYVVNGLLTEENGRLKLSREGLFVSDMVTSDLMRA